MKSTLSYFRLAFAVTLAGLAGAGALGWFYTGELSGALSFLLIGLVLAVLEISLSFDNAIVNAQKLKTMTPKWQHRFLTWGILIAVFGMRIVFPLLIVAIAAAIGPLQAIILAATEPAEYARILTDAHLSIAAFGGTFLMMVGLNYFMDADKDIHWAETIEDWMSRHGSVEGVTIALVIAMVLLFSQLLPVAEQATFVFSGIAGLLTFLLVEIGGSFFDGEDNEESGSTAAAVARGGVGAFLYLEVLDASFSFDGVIGAFALTQNLFLIAIGLGIGAMYVRSMTIMLVEKGVLSAYRYLEHGAFWAILGLAAVMYLQTLMHIPEVVTGLFGAGIIALALWSSVRWTRSSPAVAETPAE
ncbi:DUF475 domain-containing protein [Cereibacter sphaeroides]|uniref:DUF475 domain-containing protein n=1 Tax=Cereibacter sphaeroides TaxID=1063 RepID=UPI001F40BBDB|nr:DUF475 domain-containing protein [Cereibacter sphaeroides]MCE6957761.1 DUF475 domain-containing protein [Cereibacter sphaeroides]MCE6971613.1 DUF475 domain-containing protein [Cereibacter sphaeroides]